MLRNFFGSLMTLSLLTVVACNGGGGSGSGSSGPSSSIINGVFIDSPVEGLVYESESHSGQTDTQGRFSCKSGETVEFYLRATGGHVFIGDLPCRSVVSPIELVSGGEVNLKQGLSALSAEKAVVAKRALRLLQTLDNDGDPSNGIKIVQADVDQLVSAVTITDFENDLIDHLSDSSLGNFNSALSIIVSSIGGGRVAVSEANAITHFEASALACSSASSCSSAPSNGGDDEETPPSEYTCLIGYLATDSFYPNEVAINSANGQVLTRFTGTYHPVRTKSVVVFEDGSSKAKLYRPDWNYAADNYDSLSFENLVGGGNWWKFEANYNLNLQPGEGLMISGIHYANSTTSFLYFPQYAVFSPDTAEITEFSSGLSEVIDRTWTIQRNCKLPAESRVYTVEEN